MSDLQTKCRPFGEYISSRFARKTGRLARALMTRYRRLNNVNGVNNTIHRISELSRFIDQNLTQLRKLLGGRVTPFSTFRGCFLEEATLLIAECAVRAADVSQPLETVKLSTGEGVVTGIALAFRSGHVPPVVPIKLRRDREDVIVGFRRELRITSENGKGHASFPHQIIPICIIACKMYIDATRLENVLAKAKNMYTQYSRCIFMITAEWDALGEEWHDDKGRLLDSLVAPATHAVFLRGSNVRRPPNGVLRRESLRHPYCKADLRMLYRVIRDSVIEAVR